MGTFLHQMHPGTPTTLGITTTLEVAITHTQMMVMER
jgi:hypothetical protein